MRKFITILIAISCFLGFLFSAPAALSNDSFTFQGYLTDSSGAPVFGSRYMAFKIYDSRTGGNELASIDPRSVTVYNGNYATKIKFTNTSELNKLNQAEDAWMQVWVKADSIVDVIAPQNAMNPRIQLTSVPYALNTRGIYYDNENKRIGIGTKNPTTMLDVAGNVNSTGGKIQENNNSLIPRGVIVMWTGTVAPAGWTLCNGTNGAPDLRDKFILGAGGTLPQSGGSESHTHALAGKVQATALTIDQLPTHTHTAGTLEAPGAINWHHKGKSNGGFDGEIDRVSARTEITGATAPVGSNLGHDHSLSGGVATVSDNLPPYYALAYIMKL